MFNHLFYFWPPSQMLDFLLLARIKSLALHADGQCRTMPFDFEIHPFSEPCCDAVLISLLHLKYLRAKMRSCSPLSRALCFRMRQWP